MNSSNINHLLEDIYARHACKNISKYISDFETAVDIKLVPADNSNLKFTWSKDFELDITARTKRDIIFEYIYRQKSKIFSITDSGIILGNKYKLYFTFKFHPENVV